MEYRDSYKRNNHIDLLAISEIKSEDDSDESSDELDANVSPIKVIPLLDIG